MPRSVGVRTTSTRTCCSPAEPVQVFRRAVEGADVEKDQLIRHARVFEDAGHAQFGVLQHAAAWDDDGHQGWPATATGLSWAIFVMSLSEDSVSAGKHVVCHVHARFHSRV